MAPTPGGAADDGGVFLLSAFRFLGDVARPNLLATPRRVQALEGEAEDRSSLDPAGGLDLGDSSLDESARVENELAIDVDRRESPRLDLVPGLIHPRVERRQELELEHRSRRDFDFHDLGGGGAGGSTGAGGSGRGAGGASTGTDGVAAGAGTGTVPSGLRGWAAGAGAVTGSPAASCTGSTGAAGSTGAGSAGAVSGTGGFSEQANAARRASHRMCFMGFLLMSP